MAMTVVVGMRLAPRDLQFSGKLAHKPRHLHRLAPAWRVILRLSVMALVLVDRRRGRSRHRLGQHEAAGGGRLAERRRAHAGGGPLA